MSSALRRILLLVMFVSAVAAAATWWRDRDDADAASDGPPVWPPLEPLADPVTNADTAAPQPATAPAEGAAPTWKAGGDGAAAPDGYPVKAKESSGIFHVPGGRFYDRTKPDRWYATAEAAEADGYRRSKT